MSHIVCLCGSTRYYELFRRVACKETLNGNIVLKPEFYSHRSSELHPEINSETLGEQGVLTIASLEHLHRKKIRMSDEVIVVGSHRGEGLLRELKFAELLNIPIRYEAQEEHEEEPSEVESIKSDKSEELSLDVTAEDSRALHRVVRAMHDGHCPFCGYLASAEKFAKDNGDHTCPNCGETVTALDAFMALREFHPRLEKSVEIFRHWRNERPLFSRTIPVPKSSKDFQFCLRRSDLRLDNTSEYQYTQPLPIDVARAAKLSMPEVDICSFAGFDPHPLWNVFDEGAE